MPCAAGASSGDAARPHQSTDSNAEGGSVQGDASQSDPATGGGAPAGALRSGEAASAGPSRGEAAAAAVAAAASGTGPAPATPTADAGAGAAAAEAASGPVAAHVRASAPVAIRLSLEETFFLKYTLRCLTVIRAPGSTGAAATGVGPSELTEQVGLAGYRWRWEWGVGCGGAQRACCVVGAARWGSGGGEGSW